MLTTRIIPCLDISEGRTVKGVRFADLRDAGDPVELARRYESEGADELVILDVSATADGRIAAHDTVRAVRTELRIPLTVGGGVRRVRDGISFLSAGADKIAVNTAAVESPALIAELASRVGSQCVVLAIDAAVLPDHSGWEVVTHAGSNRTGLSVIDWAVEGVRLGAGEILLTSWDRDGTRNGYDLDLIRAISNSCDTPIIASGGASTPEHMVEAIDAGADAVLAASIFHNAEITIQELKTALASRGMEVRS